MKRRPLRAALAAGAAALGAVAIGAIAVGSAKIGRLAIKTGRVSRLRVDELSIGRLRIEERETEAAPAPDGWHSVTPRLVVAEPAQLVDFLKRVFGAAGEFAVEMPSLMRIGDSIVMVSGSGPRDAAPSFLYVYVADVDATFRRALEAGAESLEEPADLPYGDRRAMIKDPFGNDWQIATRKKS